MYSINQLQEKISKEITQIYIEEKPSKLYNPIKYTMETGGKRIRPALVLAACNMFTENVEPAIPVAMAYEVFHNFTLLHDDIMDNSPIRRNKKTVHKKWDQNTAILSGDAMMIKAYGFFKDLPSDLLKQSFPLFNETALQVCEGQQFDMDFESQEHVSESEYLNMIKLKTSVLIAASLKAGAICGGASKEHADLLYEFGLNIGLAFQIQDDLLDVYADTELFGKQTGNDIITGKKTFLLINALEKSDSETSEKLINIISNKTMGSQEKIALVMDIYLNLNIKTLTENKIQAFHKKAIKCLENISVNSEKKEILLEFADLIMNRKK